MDLVASTLIHWCYCGFFFFLFENEIQINTWSSITRENTINEQNFFPLIWWFIFSCSTSSWIIPQNCSFGIFFGKLFMSYCIYLFLVLECHNSLLLIFRMLYHIRKYVTLKEFSCFYRWSIVYNFITKFLYSISEKYLILKC